MKIDPPNIQVNGNLKQASVTKDLNASQGTRLPQLDQLLSQITPSGQKNIIAIVQANSIPLSKAEQAHTAALMGLHQVLLKVGNKEFKASSPVPLLQGQKVELEINPAKGLAIRAISMDKSTLINDALKLITPKQENLSQLFSLLSQVPHKLPEPEGKQQASIQLQLEKAITRLMNHPPRTQTLQNPQQMHQALKQSGVFHESQLKKVITKENQKTAQTSNLNNNPGTKVIEQDLKSRLKNFETQLRQLKQSINNTGPTIGKNEIKAHQEKVFVDKQQASKTSTEPLFAGKTKAGVKTSTSENTSQAQQHSTLKNATTNSAKLLNPSVPSGIKLPTNTNSLPPSLRNTPYFQNSQAGLNTRLPVTTGSQRGKLPVKESTEKVIETLIRQTSNALAKIQLNQISSLTQPASQSAETTTLQQWLFEIPVNTGSQVETVNILIKEEKNNSEKNTDKEKRWFVNLSFDLEELGKLQVELTLIGESAYSTIWVEQKATYESIDPQLSNLQARLEALGLNVNKLDCRRGQPPQNKPGIFSQLIDINT